jgi:hypothetical protein
MEAAASALGNAGCGQALKAGWMHARERVRRRREMALQRERLTREIDGCDRQRSEV